jgi:D-xylose transport system permease protein
MSGPGGGSGPVAESGAGVTVALRRRWATGDIGALPVLVGLAVIWLVFYALKPVFLTSGNLTNLMLQISAMGTLSVGLVLVLLLGDIDLSVGVISGLAAAVVAVLNAKMGLPAPVALTAGLAVGLAIGLANGVIITRIGLPSFVVTLAGQLALLGVLLYVLGETGTVNLRDPAIVGVAGTFFPAAVSWALGLAAMAVYAVNLWVGARRRAAAGLAAPSGRDLALRVGLVALVVLGAIAVFNRDRGLPLAVVLFVGFVVFFDVLTRHTRFGRYIFAVGGNAEAARRAGISVNGVRVTVFGLAGLMAATGGILAASRLRAVNQSSGSGDLLLNAIAAAVIGGTSLFGGRGSAWSALLGALVIGSISNGMDLLALPSSVKYIITGAVLLGAVSIDAIVRRRAQAAGRA